MPATPRARARRHARLTIKQILAWADAHRRRTGDWPSAQSEKVIGAPETWSAINDALFRGSRGLPGGSSVARLLARYRGRRHKHESRRLTPRQIVIWADAHRRRTGNWPTKQSGRVKEDRGETWSAINDALFQGNRGLPGGGSSLAKLLAQRRGRRHVRYPPPLTRRQILIWADAHYKRAGEWPDADSGPVHGAPDENWMSIHGALVYGRRGFPGGTTLPRFLRHHRGRPYQRKGPRLSERQIIKWARSHRARTGRWPRSKSGRVIGAPGETWAKIHNALYHGLRGLPGGATLLKLLAQRCGARHPRYAPPLTIKQILAWADAQRRRTGDWPMTTSGPVHGAAGENWMTIHAALIYGRRELPDGTTLARLLARHRGRRHKHEPPRLTIRQILAWADAYYQRTGDWPSRQSGRLEEDPQETWASISWALKNGTRGMRGGSSLVHVLARHRRTLYRRKGVPLKMERILEWATAHHELTGRLPTKRCGPVRGMPGETWAAIDASLRTGSRNLPGRSSLSEFLATYYARPYDHIGQRLTEQGILKWAEAFRQRVGRWPTRKSAYVDPSRTERWSTIDVALGEGNRGLPGGSSLAKLLASHRRCLKVRTVVE